LSSGPCGLVRTLFSRGSSWAKTAGPTISPGHVGSPLSYYRMATMSFPPPVFTPGSLEASPTPIVAQFGSSVEGGFTIVSGSSGRRWHVIKADRTCQFGHVFLAVEVVYSLSAGSFQFQGRGSFAIKVSDLSLSIL